MSKQQITKRELLFIYESVYSIPNGDPFTGEQRYDEDTKKILVSDVRIKRFIRDFLENTLDGGANNIFVSNTPLEKGKTNEDKKSKEKESGASARYKALCSAYGISEEKPEDLLSKVIDLRLFGGIVTAKGASINYTGPVQFAMLNPSLNKVNLRVHQNTTVFVSDTTKKQGSIGTTSVVPYSLNQIHGWVNPYSAKETQLNESDVLTMLSALWKSINLANTRTKSNQNSLLLLSINYVNADDKLYGVDKSIKIKTKSIEEEALREVEQVEWDFSALEELAKSEQVDSIEFYTENMQLKSLLENKSKFKYTNFQK